MKVTKLQIVEFFAAIQLLALFFLNYSAAMKQMLYIPTLVIGFIILVSELPYIQFDKPVIRLIVVVIALGMLNHCVIGNFDYIVLFKFLLQYFPISYLLVCYDHLSRKLWVVVAVIIVVATELAWLASLDQYTMMIGISRNYVSILLLVVMFVITIVSEKNGKEFPLKFVAVYFIMCILAIGRSGIISACLYTVLLIVHSSFKKQSATRKVWKLITIMIVSVVFISLFLSYGDILLEKIFSRFFGRDAMISNTGRQYIYIYYLQAMISSPKNFLLGVDVQEISNRLSFMGTNLHCSYLQLHCSLGMIGFVLFVVYIIKSVAFLIKHKKYYSLIFLIVFLVRILTDYAICGFIGDIIIIYYLIEPITIGQRKRRRQL